MTLHVGTGKVTAHDRMVRAIARGRTDIGFFCSTFLGVTPHPGQLEWLENAEATVNVLATANRWGKTFTIPARHFHRCCYKIGAEARYLDDRGKVDLHKFRRTKYHTVHTAGEWETAALVEQEARKMRAESLHLQALVPRFPASKPPHAEFANGARWKR